MKWLTELVNEWRAAGQRIGIVPTMGALHQGHLSLVQAARAECERVVATVFVNPTQFAPTEDLAKYPRTLVADLEMLAAERVDAVLVPTEDEMYPPGFSTYVQPPEVSQKWEGAVRPSHFRGVATVVLKLLNMTRADVCYLGQKDYQQVAVVRRMVADLNVPCEIKMCPTVRDPDGLAMSSRNRYLSKDERQIGLSLSRTLFAAEKQIRSGAKNGPELSSWMREQLIASGVSQVDYAFAADADTLEPLTEVRLPLVLLMAARVGTTRLLDNLVVRQG
ncbi:MAG: pantoate--beta-alanine ligase [Planctomycetota bacterium]|jgi:pantoate--beta-alanine ligase|nr:pantoate--beta-alanine ligase [Blastopirellula sp.]